MPSAFRLRGFHPLRPAFPYPFRLALWSFSGSPYPGMLRIPVWALSISLAATLEITFVFFSSGYLDVSVRRVPLHILLRHSCLCSSMDTRALPAWVSPFRHLRIIVYMPLPAAFRSLSRLSSALSAKASALCSSLLNLPNFLRWAFLASADSVPPSSSFFWSAMRLFPCARLRMSLSFRLADFLSFDFPSAFSFLNRFLYSIRFSRYDPQVSPCTGD